MFENNLNLKDCRTKQQAEQLCKEYNTTIKEVVLKNIDIIIDMLQDNQLKIKNNEQLINQDWVRVAVILNSMMTALGNHWYLNNE